ncbi:hypothetical protein [uncultured Sphingobacterium sp.]|uniref:hypothetical protein n=1 Tax=uncultured Sphingobacterium sp. TaxID=182688 RepID=UPI002595AB3B|nr:hypothetical protein [uncultured Sphingobacterium sp.]
MIGRLGWRVPGQNGAGKWFLAWTSWEPGLNTDSLGKKEWCWKLDRTAETGRPLLCSHFPGKEKRHRE